MRGTETPDAPLTVLAGATAREQLARHGWSPEIFTTLVGASGGAKLLGLTHLDRYLFGKYLQKTGHPMELYGSSIGSWRHAALASPDPLASITLLQERYLNQTWDQNDPRSTRQIVDGLCQWVLDGFMTDEVSKSICSHPRFTSHIVTARGRGLNSHSVDALVGIGMGLAAFANAIRRDWLGAGFQRVMFSSGEARAFTFGDFDTVTVPMNPDMVKAALIASGSIPFVMSGVGNIPGGPPGRYWDGGIVDYHFDFANHIGEGLVLYPHFSEHVIKGWFDKRFPWRRNSAKLLDRVVLLAPSRRYLTELPYGKIPDRHDFSTMGQEERIRYWHEAMEQSKLLAEAFERIVTSEDPLAWVTPLPDPR